jgi:hypothetical protein
MSFERPSKGVLNFQCDACYDIRELSKSEGDPVSDIRACLRIVTEEGWRSDGSGGHLCEDCANIVKSERERRI